MSISECCIKKRETVFLTAYFRIRGSGKPKGQISAKTVHARRREPSLLILVLYEMYQISEYERIIAKSSIYLIINNILSVS